jgi:hypothetical protein
MATKKSHRPAPPANGAPVAEPAPKESPDEMVTTPEPARHPRMTKAQLEQHVHSLEAQVAQLKAELEEIRGPQVPWWKKIVGSHADDPEAFNEAMRLGREWRDSFRPKERSSKKKSPKQKSRKVNSADGRS